MPRPQPIILACWIILLVYWVVSARSVKPIQETRGWLAGNWNRILLAIGLMFAADFSFMRDFGFPVRLFATRLFPFNAAMYAASVVLMVGGLIVAVVARRTLAGNWSSAVALKKGHELITTGIYQYVRHPIYTGFGLMFVGTTLGTDTLGAAIGFLIVALGTWLKLKEEEALMAEHFPEQYPQYRMRTKRLIPFVW